MNHTVKGKKDLLVRVRKIVGQSQALEKSLDTEIGCMEVLQQIAAIKGSISSLMSVVLEDHIREHLGGEMPAATREQEMEILIRAIKSYWK